MATLIDEEAAQENQSQEEVIGTIEELESHSEEQQAQENPTFIQDDQEQQQDELPEKYRGKSVKELVEMHENAERALGKQGSEVGELRKTIDTYISQNLTQQQSEPVPETIDYFDSPEQAVNQAIDNHPKVRQAALAAEEMQKQSAVSALKQKHPDMQDVLGNPKFAEWVQESPVRQELFQRADQGYDFNSADELISTFKERAQIAQQTLATEGAARKRQVQSASTGSASAGADTSSAKKVYRRIDLIKLLRTDPDRYDSLQPEIMKAYEEGRVR